MSPITASGGTAAPDVVGGKAHVLLTLTRAGFDVPPFVVVPAPAVGSSDDEGGEDVLPPALRAELRRALDTHLAGIARFAVRSSAVEEDGADHSFAGQLSTVLDVAREDVEARVARVRRSGATDAVRAYRERRGLSGAPRPPAVIVQAMVASDAAGVAFASDASAGRPDAWVSAARGLGDRLVGGAVDGDLYALAHDLSSYERRAGTDERSVLGREEVLAVGRLAEEASRRLGAPQDVEFAFERGRLRVLQARPVTAGRVPAALPRRRALWDDSNIAESYPGVTSPLTFSFLRLAYAEVYRSFAAVMGVRAARRDEERGTFANMLGYHRGRVYYNLLNWYRVVALLPGYRSNAAFLESMLGVDRDLPADLREGAASGGPGGSPARLLHLARMGLRLGWRFATLPLAVRSWRRRLRRALGPHGTHAAARALEGRSAADLVARYRALERDLLSHWAAPIVNDFFGMVFHGLLRRWSAHWCADADGALANGVLSAAGEVVSAEPARRVRALADLVRGRDDLVASLGEGRVPPLADFQRDLAAYLDRFADRCPEELKLESRTLADDATPLLRAVASFARRAPDAAGAPGAADVALSNAREEARRRLARHPIRQALFALAHAQARRRLRERENLRFERTRLFGEVRRVVRALGERLAAAGAIDDPRDVFLLELEEALGFVEGTAVTRDLRGLVAVRRAEQARWRAAAPPPPRFWTRTLADADTAEEDVGRDANGPLGEARTGLGLSGGTVRGRARIVRDPRVDRLEPGEVLVAARTDPGWILAFASASALVVERGSLLSHVAILARELGVPAVTGLPGAAEWLRDGDLVEVDGDAGRVTRLVADGAQAGAAREATVTHA